MIKTYFDYIIKNPKKLLVALFMCLFATSSTLSHAYWIWTPESKKWVNPKYSSKGTPRDQYDWGMQFYLVKDYPKAISEFNKLIRSYPHSELAPDAQYYIGRSREEKREYYAAYQAYQKVIDVYPRTELTEEIIERQYKIANLFYGGQKERLFGVEILPAIDKAIEIFGKVVDNSPYGKYADLAQFKIGECFKKNGQYPEAAEAFGNLISEYPKSLLYKQARYEIAYCTYKMSLKSSYDQEPTEEAIREFEEFIKSKDGGKTLEEAEDALTRLQEKKAESLYDTGYFYEKSKRYKSAIVYYRDILESYPKTSWAKKAFNKIMELERKIKIGKKKKKKWYQIF